jgi:hypothetical protein
MLLNALKSASLIIAAARGVKATPNAQAAAAPEIKEDIFIVKFFKGRFNFRRLPEEI